MIVLESKLAKKYATAFLNVYGERCTPEYFENIKKLLKFIQTNNVFQAILNLPSLTIKNRKEIVDFVSNKLNLQEPIKKLVMVLLKKKRIDLLGEVLKKILLIQSDKEKKHHFEVTTSHEINEKEKTSIKKFIQNLIKTNVTASFKTDKSLIVGIKIEGNKYLWERSLSKKLRDIEQKILLREEI
jgi:ATP synthase F1 delta subunit